MQPQMFYIITVLYEILITKSAFIRFLSSMCMHGMHMTCKSAAVLYEKVTQWLLCYSFFLVSVYMICKKDYHTDWIDKFLFYYIQQTEIKVLNLNKWKKLKSKINLKVDLRLELKLIFIKKLLYVLWSAFRLLSQVKKWINQNIKNKK